MHGVQITIIHQNGSTRTEAGLMNQDPNTKKNYVGFYPGTDIQIGDTLISPDGDTMHVVDMQTSYFRSKAEELRAFYLTDTEYKRSQESSSPLHIDNAYGVSIGDGNTVIVNYIESLDSLKQIVSTTDAPEKAEMEKVVSLLEMVVNNQVPASKGLFSKFSSLMERHSWLSSAVASTILGWLMSQIG